MWNNQGSRPNYIRDIVIFIPVLFRSCITIILFYINFNFCKPMDKILISISIFLLKLCDKDKTIYKHTFESIIAELERINKD